MTLQQLKKSLSLETRHGWLAFVWITLQRVITNWEKHCGLFDISWNKHWHYTYIWYMCSMSETIDISVWRRALFVCLRIQILRLLVTITCMIGELLRIKGIADNITTTYHSNTFHVLHPTTLLNTNLIYKMRAFDI